MRITTTYKTWRMLKFDFNFSRDGPANLLFDPGRPGEFKFARAFLVLFAPSKRTEQQSRSINNKFGVQSAEHYLIPACRSLSAGRDGEQNVAVLDEGGSSTYWNILANGVIGRYNAAGDRFYYLKDHPSTSLRAGLGSTRAVVNSNGTVVEAHDYYTYGLLMPGRSFITGEETKEKFVGKELDSETGWYHLGFRSLMSALGRFPSPDRFADEYPSLSPYQYAANNPLLFIDLTGDTLDLAGDTEKALQFVHSLVDEDIQSRITVDENGRVSFNTEGLYLTNDIGLQLANALINSEQKYLVAVQNTYQGVNRTTGDLLTLEIPSSGIANLSITPRNYGASLSGEGLAPIPGYQGQIVFGIGEWQYSSSDTRIKPISNIAFHEFMENFNRTVNQMPYYYDATKTTGAHPYAIDRARLFKLQVGPAGKGYFIPKP